MLWRMNGLEKMALGNLSRSHHNMEERTLALLALDKWDLVTTMKVTAASNPRAHRQPGLTGCRFRCEVLSRHPQLSSV